MYTGNKEDANELNEDLQIRFPDLGFVIYSNEPDFPFTVVANDEKQIVTQVYLANYILKRWMKRKYWRPDLTEVELKALSTRRTKHDARGSLGLPIKEINPNEKNQYQLQHKKYLELVQPRLDRNKKRKVKLNELLGS